MVYPATVGADHHCLGDSVIVGQTPDDGRGRVNQTAEFLFITSGSSGDDKRNPLMRRQAARGTPAWRHMLTIVWLLEMELRLSQSTSALETANTITQSATS